MAPAAGDASAGGLIARAALPPTQIDLHHKIPYGLVFFFFFFLAESGSITSHQRTRMELLRRLRDRRVKGAAGRVRPFSVWCWPWAQSVPKTIPIRRRFARFSTVKSRRGTKAPNACAEAAPTLVLGRSAPGQPRSQYRHDCGCYFARNALTVDARDVRFAKDRQMSAVAPQFENLRSERS